MGGKRVSLPGCRASRGRDLKPEVFPSQLFASKSHEADPDKLEEPKDKATRRRNRNACDGCRARKVKVNCLLSG
jgi:hypothetical protein